jgi:hypothetical protein
LPLAASSLIGSEDEQPRGRGGLSEEELSSPENCIWLCSEHATIVDNNRGISYPPEELLAYKALQEARIARERQGLYVPVGWLFDLTIGNNPLFERNQKLRLAKLNFVFGSNMTGKSALAEWIAGVFDPGFLRRWQLEGSKPIDLQLTFLNPSSHCIRMQVNSNKSLACAVDGQPVPFNPIPLKIFQLKNITLGDDEGDDIVLSRNLQLPPLIIENLFEEVDMYPHSKVKNLHYKDDEETGRRCLHADVEGTVPGLPLHCLSGREVERIFIELATAAARAAGRYTPTLLILDGCPSILFEGFFDFYSHHLLDPENHFQTLLCVPTRNFNFDSLRWNGWEVFHTTGRAPNVSIRQGLSSPPETAESAIIGPRKRPKSNPDF